MDAVCRAAHDAIWWCASTTTTLPFPVRGSGLFLPLNRIRCLFSFQKLPFESDTTLRSRTFLSWERVFSRLLVRIPTDGGLGIVGFLGPGGTGPGWEGGTRDGENILKLADGMAPYTTVAAPRAASVHGEGTF